MTLLISIRTTAVSRWRKDFPNTAMFVNATCCHYLCVDSAKCVDGFDHHCKWLNTCIGRHNYKIFYVTLSSATGLVVFEVIVEIVLIICFVVDKGSLQTTISRFYGESSGSIDSWLIATSIMLALMIPVGALLVQLWTFHVGLIRDKTTTYAYLREPTTKKCRKNA